MKILRTAFWLFINMIWTTAVWAQDATPNATNGFTDIDSIRQHTDLSINFLGQFFGSIGGALQGVSGQMLGKLFYKLNEGIVIVAGIWLVYTVLQVLLSSLHEGSFMGQNQKIHLVLFRIALGFSLLIPNPATGYSLLQSIVMKVVVQGVGLANQTWDYALDYLQDGGTVWVRPPNGDNDLLDSNSVHALLGDPSDAGKQIQAANTIFASEVCMFASNDVARQNNATATSGSSMMPYYDVKTDETASKFNFPGSLSSADDACGSVSWDIKQYCSGGSKNATQCAYAQQAVGNLIDDLRPAAQQFYCSKAPVSKICAGASSTFSDDEMNEMFFGAYIDYVNIIHPVMQLDHKGDATSATTFIDHAKKDGWLTAGRYYWDLSQVQTAYDDLGKLNGYVPAPTTFSGQEGNANPEQYRVSAQKYFVSQIPAVVNLVNSYHSAQTKGDTGTGQVKFPGLPHSGNKWADKVIMSLINVLTGGFINLILLFSTGSGGLMGPDPILFLHKVGMNCLGIASLGFFGSLGVVGMLTVIKWPCFQLDPLIAWVRPFFMIISSALWVVGFVLGFYVPMYPYLVYTFGVIGWFIAVLEAMVAAPLICFGLTHPSGHDLLGEAKQALILLLGIFLRPVLMVIGLIASMILSYIALRLVVYTFSGFVADLFYVGTPPSVGSPSDVLPSALLFMSNITAEFNLSSLAMILLAFPLILVAFTFLVYVVTTQCFSLIYVLPENILKWIGGHETRTPAGEMAHRIQGGFSSAAGYFARGAQQGKQGMDKAAEKKKEAAENSKLGLNPGKGNDGGGSGGGGNGGGANNPSGNNDGGGGANN